MEPPISVRGNCCAFGKQKSRRKLTGSSGTAEPASPQRVLGKGKFPDDFPADQMFLNDALQHFRRAGVVPDAFGINDRNRPAHADAQAVGLGAINQRLRPGEIQFLEPALQKFPRRQTRFARRNILARSGRRTKKCAGGIFQCRAFQRRFARSSSMREGKTNMPFLPEWSQRENVRPMTPATAINAPMSSAPDSFAVNETRHRQQQDGRRGDDGGDDARGRVFERPLHAAHADRLAGQAVGHHPRPEAAPFFAGDAETFCVQRRRRARGRCAISPSTKATPSAIAPPMTRW